MRKCGKSPKIRGSSALFALFLNTFVIFSKTTGPIWTISVPLYSSLQGLPRKKQNVQGYKNFWKFMPSEIRRTRGLRFCKFLKSWNLFRQAFPASHPAHGYNISATKHKFLIIALVKHKYVWFSSLLCQGTLEPSRPQSCHYFVFCSTIVL